MIEPREFSPYSLVECLNSGLREKLFISFSSKYLLYDNGLCVFEVLSGSIPQGYYLNSAGKYQSIEDIFYFTQQIRIKYPDVADWFLFNIKKFS
jgi:hypothetical protein